MVSRPLFLGREKILRWDLRARCACSKVRHDLRSFKKICEITRASCFPLTVIENEWINWQPDAEFTPACEIEVYLSQAKTVGGNCDIFIFISYVTF